VNLDDDPAPIVEAQPEDATDARGEELRVGGLRAESQPATRVHCGPDRARIGSGNTSGTA
jgi:hypothetical protein